MVNDHSNKLGVRGEFQPVESLQSPISSQSNDDTGSPNEAAAPCGVVVVHDDANPSPDTALLSADGKESADSPNVNAFRAAYQRTQDGIHLSIPVAPAALPQRFDFNYDNYDGADSDGEVGPFYDAVADEEGLDSDDDCSWADELNRPSAVEHQIQPPQEVQPELQRELPRTETELMLLLSNSQLKEELRKRNLSTGGNKTAMVQRLLTMIATAEVVQNSSAPEQAAHSNEETARNDGVEAYSNEPTSVNMTEEQLMQLSNAALKDMLKEKKLSTNGSKAVMVQRILTGIPRTRSIPRNRNPQLAEEEEEGEVLTGFPSTAKWKELLPSQEPVREPTMPGLRAPTVPEGEEPIAKLNFEETFDREPFIEQCEVLKEVNGKLVKDRRGNYVTETVTRIEGRAKKDWLQKNKLTPQSLPDKWIGALLQDKKQQNDPKSVVTISDWCTYSNCKAMLCNAGQKGGIYPEFTNFSPDEIKSFLGLYILNGLNPSPQVKM